MTRKNDIHSILRDVLVRLGREEARGVEITRTAVSCPDSPDDAGLSRRDMLGRLSLLLAGAAAFKLQGCGACNDFGSNSDDAGSDASDAGDAGCSLDCTTDCSTDCSSDCSTDCATDCTTDTCTTDTCTTDACTTDCTTDCSLDCTTECSADCATDGGSSFF